MKSYLVFIFLSIAFSLFSQITPPYFNDFEQGISGWETSTSDEVNYFYLGTPNTTNYKRAHSGTNALNILYTEGPKANGRVNYIVSPVFDFTDMPEELFLSYHQLFHGGSSMEASILVQYNIGESGWKTLFFEEDKSNNFPRTPWKTSRGTAVYTGLRGPDPLSSYNFCSHSLSFFKGMKDVRFRFKFTTSSAQYDDIYSIDDFSIDIDKSNIQVLNNYDVVYSQKKGQGYNFKMPVRVVSHNYQEPNYILEYYLSKDTIIDEGDIYLREDDNILNSSQWMNPMFGEGDLIISDTIAEGIYYVIYKVLPNVYFSEIDSNDNDGYIRINHFYTAKLSLKEPDKEGQSYFNTLLNNSYWEKSITSSGMITYAPPISDNIWYVKPNSGSAWLDKQSLISNVLDFSEIGDSTIYCSFRYLKGNGNINLSMYSNNRPQKGVLVSSEGYGWGNVNIDITEMANWAIPQLKIRAGTSISNQVVSALDGIYIGAAKPDLSIKSESNIYIPSNKSQSFLSYTYTNTGPIAAESAVTKFYLSYDDVFDLQDTLLAVITEEEIGKDTFMLRDLHYDVPVDVDSFYVFYTVDADNEIDEMWERDNIGFLLAKKLRLFDSIYTNNFSDDSCWFEQSTEGNIIEIGNIADVNYTGTYTGWGEKSVVFNLSDNRGIHSYWHSPLFNVDKLEMPILSVDLYQQVNSMFLEYSIDGGINWYTLEPFNNSFESPESLKYLDFPDVRHNMEVKMRPYRVSYDISELKGRNILFRFGNRDSYYDMVLDNIKITEGDTLLSINKLNATIDLIDRHKVSLESVLENWSNVFIDSIKLDYYISMDNTLSSGDSLLYTKRVYNVLPGIKVENFDTLSNFSISMYSYLFLVASSTEEVLDTLKCKLFPDLIDSYPYHEEFNSLDGGGWKEYSSLHDYHARLQLSNNSNADTSYYWLTDDLPYWAEPDISIVSPVFDFSALDSVYLSFLLRCRGSYLSDKGGNMSYSFDNGVTWQVLGVKDDTLGYNWYNTIDGEHKWKDYNFGVLHRAYNATKILAGKSNVQFKLTNNFRSGEKPPLPGLHFDNFTISDQQAYFDLTPGNGLEIQLDGVGYYPRLPYKIINNGNSNAGDYNLNFYYSKDSILDANDSFIRNYSGAYVQANDTATGWAYLSSLPVYCVDSLYLLYTVDVDNQVNESYAVRGEADISKVGYTKLYYSHPSMKINEFTEDTVYICKSDLVKLSVDEVSTSDTYSYIWSDGTNRNNTVVTDTGYYTIALMDSKGCVVSRDFIWLHYHEEEIPEVLFDLTNGNDTLLIRNKNNFNVIWSNNDSSAFTAVTDKSYYYYLIEDENGCMVRSTSVFNKYTAGFALDGILSSDSLFCEGDSVLLTSPLANSYLWSTGDTTQEITVQQGGNYSYVNRYSSGDLNSKILIVRELQYPDSTLQLSDNTICEGDTAIISAEKNDGFSYRWSNYRTDGHQIYIHKPGSFWVEITNRNRCASISEVVKIELLDSPLQPSIEQVGYKLFVNDEYFHVWYSEEGLVDSSNLSYYLPNIDGAYFVESMNTDGCVSEKSENIIYSSPSIEKGAFVAPNPFRSSTVLLLSLIEDSSVEITLISQNGAQLREIKDSYLMGNHYITIDAKDFNIPVGQSFLNVIVNGTLQKSIKLLRLE